jgi:Family of unknown function (DUF6496)
MSFQVTGTSFALGLAHELEVTACASSPPLEVFKERDMASKYGSTAKREVKSAMHERKHGKLHSGKSGKKVTSRKQAIAIGLSKARKKGGRVPSKSK